mgnify:CR=1 FL=1
MKIFIGIIIVLTPHLLFAGCKEDFGTPERFGSYEQLQHIQKEISQNNCDFIHMNWNSKTFQGTKIKRMIVLDLKEGVMIRVRGEAAGMSSSWEFWYGFNRETVLNGDPSDGIDLPNYTTSFDRTKLSRKMNKALKRFK